MLRREEFPYLTGTIYIMKSTIDNNNNAWILLGKLQIKKCPMHVAGWHWRPPSVSLDDATSAECTSLSLLAFSVSYVPVIGHRGLGCVLTYRYVASYL